MASEIASVTKRARANRADALWAFTIDRRIVVSYRGMYCNPGRLQGWRWWKDSLSTELTFVTSRVSIRCLTQQRLQRSVARDLDSQSNG